MVVLKRTRWWLQILLLFHPNPGEMIQFDHQLDKKRCDDERKARLAKARQANEADHAILLC